MPSFVNAFGVAYDSLNGSVEGPTTSSGHPFTIEEATFAPWSHGATFEPLRPECASWIAIYMN